MEKKTNFEKDFKKILKVVYDKSHKNKNATRSNERLKILHGYIQKILIDEIGNKRKIISFNTLDDSTEYTYNGPMNEKKIDISIIDLRDENKAKKFFISVKFIISNYKQNSINYFEQMVAETANIKLGNNESFQLIIIRKNPPYFESNKKSIKHIENTEIDNKFLETYQKYLNIDNVIISSGICLMMVDFQDKEIINEYINENPFSFKKYSSSIIENTKSIKISYPLMKKKLNGALTFNDMISKIINSI